MLLAVLLPELNKQLGIYIPLIVVNCIIFARAEMFAQKMDLYFPFSMPLGWERIYYCHNHYWLCQRNPGFRYMDGISRYSNLSPATFFILPAGGFMIMGFLVALFNKLANRKKNDNTIEHQDACAVGCPLQQCCWRR